MLVTTNALDGGVGGRGGPLSPIRVRSEEDDAKEGWEWIREGKR